MIIPALIDHYDRLAAAPNTDLAPYGFSEQKVSFCIVLRADGTLVEIADAREAVTRGKSTKLVPRQVVVLGQSKPPGSGVNPCLLWDNASYLLGWKADDPKPDRTRASFDAFREKHLKLRVLIEDEGFESVCRFLAAWDPGAFRPDAETQECLASFGVFRLFDEHRYIHDRPAVRSWYIASLDEAPGAKDDQVTPSLTTGRPSRIARLHEPKIKGVRDAQTSGATIVSFNNDAFESYGKSQGENAPVSEQDAFKYCTALNCLLAGERRTTIGDATVVWWVDEPDAEEGADVLSMFFGGGAPEAIRAEDPAKAARLEDAIARLSRGAKPNLAGTEAGFHVLGLSPNAARISVRFWWSGPIGTMIERVARHHEDALLQPIAERERNQPLTIYSIVRQTARIHGDRPDMDTVSPTLAGEVARAIITGGPYPMSLLETVVRRARTDGRITHARAAIVKACITRRRRLLGGTTEEVPVSLNKDGPPAYQLGRLFAVLEKTQADALGSVNASIGDRYFASASSTPASVFPRLLRLTQHHMDKLEGGRRVNRERLIQEIVSHLDTFPSHLRLEDQGLFQIGYFHQREDLFTKKPETEDIAE